MRLTIDADYLAMTLLTYCLLMSLFQLPLLPHLMKSLLSLLFFVITVYIIGCDFTVTDHPRLYNSIIKPQTLNGTQERQHE